MPLCAPSQKGCLELRPQEHHQYFFPASTSTANGAFAATTAWFEGVSALEDSGIQSTFLRVTISARDNIYDNVELGSPAEPQRACTIAGLSPRR